MKEQIHVTVVITAKNAALHLRECLDSVLGQTLGELQVLCADLSSKDATPAIIREYAERDTRVEARTRAGADDGGAENACLEEALGTYTFFLRGDDLIPERDALERLVRAAEEADAKVCGGIRVNYINRRRIDEVPAEQLPGTFCYADRPFVGDAGPFLFRTSFLWEKGLRFDCLTAFREEVFLTRVMAEAGSYVRIPARSFLSRSPVFPVKPEELPSRTVQDLLRGIKEILKTASDKGYGELRTEALDKLSDPDLRIALRQHIDRRNYRTMELLTGLAAARGEAETPDNGELAGLLADAENGLTKRNERPAVPAPCAAPKVTVIMPSLNVEPFIRLCMESVLDQTMKDLEILCVDAGSGDGTLEILREYAEKDRRVTLLQSDRRSYGYQVNMGIRRARGEYIAIVETDDFIAPDMYEVLYREAKESGAEVIKADVNYFKGDGSRRKVEKWPVMKKSHADCYGRILDPLTDRWMFTQWNTVAIWAGLYERRFLEESGTRCNETPGASFQDNGFWFQVLMNSRRVMISDHVFYHLRRDNPNSSVMSADKMNCMTVETDFIRAKILERDEETRKIFLPVCGYFRFRNYMFTYSRIHEEDKPGYLKRCREEFLALEAAGELDLDLFEPDLMKKLVAIMEDPETFYARDVVKTRLEMPEMYRNERKKYENEKKRAEQEKKQREKAQRTISEMERSEVWTAGTRFTGLKAKVRGIFGISSCKTEDR